jgi:hypothetical protein
MKTIPLSQGKYAVVDEKDYEFLSQWKWSLSNGYAVRGEYKKGKRKTIYMHRLITGFKTTDHINRNSLDNRRANLRECTVAQNAHNRVKQKNNTSGYKGVYFHKLENKWMSAIISNGKRIHLGYFSQKKEANEAYKKAALIYHGEFANI